jgi:2-oxoglutarate ferredoxin oxidoreductase subunit beta
VLSPCQTFRPEQREWKNMVHPCHIGTTHNPVEAAQLIQADDGMALGLLYVEEMPPWQPPRATAASLASIEQELQL